MKTGCLNQNSVTDHRHGEKKRIILENGTDFSKRVGEKDGEFENEVETKQQQLPNRMRENKSNRKQE